MKRHEETLNAITKWKKPILKGYLFMIPAIWLLENAEL